MRRSRVRTLTIYPHSPGETDPLCKGRNYWDLLVRRSTNFGAYMPATQTFDLQADIRRDSPGQTAAIPQAPPILGNVFMVNL